MTPPTYLSADQIRTDGGTQPRAGLDQTVVADYGDQFDGPNSWPFPPVVVFHDGTDYWLADGFHRLYASLRYARQEKFASPAVLVDIHQGDRRDAILHSVGANAKHGLRRTNEDKRRAVSRLLEDAEWSQWSNREIARRCDVDEKLVRSLRGELSAAEPQIADTTRTATRNGVVYTIDTANIGTAHPAPVAASQAAPQSSAQPAAPAPAAPTEAALIFCFRCGLRRDDPASACPRCAELSYIDHIPAAWAKASRWEHDHDIPIHRSSIPPADAADLLRIDAATPDDDARMSDPSTDNIALSPDRPTPAQPSPALADDGEEWLRIQSLHNALSQILALLHPELRQIAEDYSFGVEFDRLIADARSLRKEISCLSPLDRINI